MPSRTRLDTGGDHRTVGVAWTLRRAVALCACVALLAVLPSTADAAGDVSPCAPDLAKVASFHGHASLDFEQSASGEDPGEGGSESVTLSHRALGLRIDMHRTQEKKIGTDFVGTATEGEVRVEDVFANSGTGFSGTQSFAGPVAGSGPNYGVAQLRIDRRKSHCKYELAFSFGVAASYSGDPETDQPAPEVGGGAYSGLVHLPDSLKLQGSFDAPTLLSCRETVLLPKPCATFSGGWKTDFATLFLCHSVEAVGCADDRQPIGTAPFNWSLIPVFKK